MPHQFIKQLRQYCLNAIWSIHGQRPPQRAVTLAEWLREQPDAAIKYDLQAARTIHYRGRRTVGNVASALPLLRTLSDGEHLASEITAAKRWDYEEQYVVSIPHGRIVSSLGLIVTPDDRQLRELSGAAFAGLFPHPLTYNGMLAPVKRIPGRVAVLANGCSQRNYYHWTLEILPRIRQLEAAGIKPDYYCVPGRHRYHRESLEYFGIPARKQIYIGKYAHLQAEELIVPSITQWVASTENADFLYQRMAKASWSKTQAADRRRIYIARRRKNVRHVTNESALFSELQKLGFTRHFLEDYSVREQIALFQQADFVLGPHGAGLVNLLYCNAGTKVVEIVPPIRPSALFYYLAHNRQLDYSAYFGTSVNCRHGESNIEVDVAELLDHVVGELQPVRHDRASAA